MNFPKIPLIAIACLAIGSSLPVHAQNPAAKTLQTSQILGTWELEVGVGSPPRERRIEFFVQSTPQSPSQFVFREDGSGWTWNEAKKTPFEWEIRGDQIDINTASQSIHGEYRSMANGKLLILCKLDDMIAFFLLTRKEGPSAKLPKPVAVTTTDPRDGAVYPTVKIAGKTWMARNLAFAAKDSKCPDDKPENCSKLGRFYDWETARKACPAGWHLPTSHDWFSLYDAVDRDAARLWATEHGGTNASGFALLSTYRSSTAEFWTSDPDRETMAWKFSMHLNAKSGSYNAGKQELHSVRCVEGAAKP